MDGAAHECLWVPNWNVNGGKLNVEANSSSNPNEWNDGNRVSGGYAFLSPPTLRRGSFRFKAFLPSADHASESISFF